MHPSPIRSLPLCSRGDDVLWPNTVRIPSAIMWQSFVLFVVKNTPRRTRRRSIQRRDNLTNAIEIPVRDNVVVRKRCRRPNEERRFVAARSALEIVERISARLALPRGAQVVLRPGPAGGEALFRADRQRRRVGRDGVVDVAPKVPPWACSATRCPGCSASRPNRRGSALS